jgi:hypothetical protein
MANTNRPHGFHPVSYLNGAPWNGQARTYYIPAADGDAYFAGDPVKTQAGASAGMAAGQMSVGVARAAKAAGTDVVRGVAIAFGANPADPSASSVPAVKRSSYLVAVVDDPLVLFEVQGDNTGTLEETVIGKFASFNVAAPDSAGFSASTLNTASIDSDSGLPLRILGLASGTFGPYCRFLVVWNLHELQGGTTTEAVVGDQAANTVYAGPESGADDAPEFRELVLEDLPSEVQDLVNSPVVATPGGRVAADGTLLASEGLVGSNRVGLGDYTATIDGTAQTIGGFIQMWPVATPSGLAGDGGSGISAFKEFSGSAVALTDNTASIQFYYSEENNKVYALGTDTDNIWIHDIDDWTAAAVQEDPGAAAIRTAGQSGVLDNEGEVVWLSGDNAGSVPIRAYVIATDTHVDFGTTTDSVIMGANDGYIVVHEGSSTLSFSPNLGTGALGLAVDTWAIDTNNSIDFALAWDKNGYGWTWTDGASSLYAFQPGNVTFDTHKFPYVLDSGGTTQLVATADSPPVYDSLRHAILISLQGVGTTVPAGVWRYSGWVPGIDSSGHWERVTSGHRHVSIAFDPATDIISAVGRYVLQEVYRYTAQDGLLIDTVSVDDTEPASQVDYDLGSSRRCFYLNESFYIGGGKSGSQYIIRIDYQGADITGIGGSGVSAVPSVLFAQTSVINDTTAGIQIYRSLDPPVRADAQFSVHIGFK